MRKVLSFVLVLALVLSSFSMAFASEATTSLSDIAGNANEEAITVNFNLGIIDGMGDGTFAPAAAVTRAQFAAMITRALAVPDSALAGYTATSFKDTTGFGWAVPYLAFCQSKGILVGDGAGNVMPGKTVSVNEAMTMVLRAIGYTNNSAALVGAWPSNYVSLAQNNSLYDDVTATAGVTRAIAAQIIYNALTVDKVEVAADGTTKVLDGKSMLTTGLNCTMVKDVVINGDEDSLINLKAYIGQKVTVYKNSDKEIVAIASVATDVLAGDFDVATDIRVTNVTTGAMALSPAGVVFNGDDDVDYTVKGTPEFFNYYLNGKLMPAGAQSFTKDDAVTIYGDVSGKYINGISSITRWVADNAKKVAKADLNTIADGSLLGSSFETLKDGSIDTNSFELVGATSLDKIAADNVVYVYEKGGNGDIVKVEVGTKVVEGKVTTTKSDNTKIVVNGTTYEQASNAKAKDITKVKAGDTVKLYLDVNGDVFSYDVTSGTTDKYGVVMNKDTMYDKVKLYTADDESKWFEYDSADAATFVTTNTTFQGIGLVAYGLDSKGAIDSVTNGGVVNATHSTLTALTLKADSKSYKVSSDCLVFSVDTAVSPDAVDSIAKIGDVDTGKDLGSVTLYKDSDGIVVALMVSKAFTNATAEDSYAVISEVNSTTNADDDAVQQVIGFYDGTALDKLTTDDTTAPTTLTVPNLYKVQFDSAGVIKSVTKVNTSGAVGLQNITVGAIVNDIDGNNIQTTAGGVASDWLPIATDSHVYRAVLKDGEVDYYKVSDVSSINTGYKVYLYNTVDDDDSTGSDGYDVVIFVTTGDM